MRKELLITILLFFYSVVSEAEDLGQQTSGPGGETGYCMVLNSKGVFWWAHGAMAFCGLSTMGRVGKGLIRNLAILSPV